MVTQEGAQVYRIGVIPTCPVHQITVGGQCFPRRSEVVSGFGIETKRKELQGAVVKLTQGTHQCSLPAADCQDQRGSEDQGHSLHPGEEGRVTGP